MAPIAAEAADYPSTPVRSCGLLWVLCVCEGMEMCRFASLQVAIVHLGHLTPSSEFSNPSRRFESYRNPSLLLVLEVQAASSYSSMSTVASTVDVSHGDGSEIRTRISVTWLKRELFHGVSTQL